MYNGRYCLAPRLAKPLIALWVTLGEHLPDQGQVCDVRCGDVAAVRAEEFVLVDLVTVPFLAENLTVTI